MRDWLIFLLGISVILVYMAVGIYFGLIRQ